MWGIEWAVVLAMILFNSVFAAYEIALASVTLARLQILVREKRPGAKAAFEMKERMEASLAVVQVGITLVGAIAAAASGGGACNLSEWVAGHLGHPVRGGDVSQRNRLRVLVRKVRRQHVLEAQICASAGQEDA